MAHKSEDVLVYKLSDDVAPSLRKVLASRGWQEWDKNKHGRHEWNLIWTTKRYLAKDLYGLHPHQKVNHFRNTSSITKKDNLLRNLRRMRGIHGKIYDFYPQSWMIPLQFSDFLRATKTITTSKKGSDESDTGKTNIWIAKPTCGRRGENIVLFTNISQFTYTQAMIVQKYIDNPLLIGGYKFDLRLYVLVTSFRPLKIWFYKNGLCRFSTEKYDLSDLDNCFSHLTNASINKDSITFEENKPIIGEGSKWTLKQLFVYLIQSERCNHVQIRKLKRVIRDIITLTLLSIVNDVEQSSHCFELFGFDIMIDENLKCWLLEVNGSPAIAITGETDAIVKTAMLNDLVRCINVEKPSSWRHEQPIETNKENMRKSKPKASKKRIKRHSADSDMLRNKKYRDIQSVYGQLKSDRKSKQKPKQKKSNQGSSPVLDTSRTDSRTSTSAQSERSENTDQTQSSQDASSEQKFSETPDASESMVSEVFDGSIDINEILREQKATCVGDFELIYPFNQVTVESNSMLDFGPTSGAEFQILSRNNVNAIKASVSQTVVGQIKHRRMKENKYWNQVMRDEEQKRTQEEKTSKLEESTSAMENLVI